MAWRDDCTKHKPKTGGMSTKLGESQEIKPKFDQTFADQPPHPPGCAPRGHGTGIPAILDGLMEATPVSSPKKTPNHSGIFARAPESSPWGEQRGDAVGHFTGNFAVYDATENFAGYDATGNFAVYDATENFAGDDATGYFAGNDATGYFAGSSSPAERGEKRRWRSRPAERGEKRRWRSMYSSRAVGGDGGHYAAVPNVDPGGQQRPEVSGTFCGRGPGPLSLVAPESAFLIGGDTSLSTLRSGRFRPASEDRRRSYRSNRDRFKKSINARL